MSTPSLAQLHQAVAIAEKIQKLEAELASIMGGSSPVASAPKAVSKPAGKKGKRTMSAETIAKMRASQKARWAKPKGEGIVTAVVKAEKKVAAKIKRTMSPEGRARIVAALKARWAAKKKAAK